MANEPQSNKSPSISGLPLSLGRNGACLPCRKRKMRCDGVRPVCANCEKVMGKKRWKGLVCAWEDKPDGGKDARRQRQGGHGQDEPQHDSSSRAVDAPKVDESRPQVQFDRPSPRVLSPPAPLVPLSAVDTRSPTGLAPVPTDWFASSGGAGRSAISENVSNASLMGVEWSDWTKRLIPSGWPADLPGPDVVSRVCKLFFERVPTIPKMLHRGAFFQSLGLPPNHQDFPATCLLHALLAITAPHLPPSSASDPAYLPRDGISAASYPEPRITFDDLPGDLRNLGSSFHLGSQEVPDHPMGAFQLWHRWKAFAKVSETFDRGGDMVQAVQAQCIATTVDRYNAWWTDVWQEAGATIRLAIPLGLNESQGLPLDGLKRIDNLKPPVTNDPVRQAIDDRTWWMCYLTEREFGMSTAWTESVPDDEISVELPVTQALFDAGVGDLRGTQTLHASSEDLYYAHPAVHEDSLSLLIKSVKLFSEVNKFFRKYSRLSHTIAGFLTHPTFHRLMCRVNAMLRSFPKEMRRPALAAEGSAQGGFDVDMIAASMTVQAATLTLLEPCLTGDMYKSATGQLAASSIRAVEHILHEVNATAFDITLLPSVCPFIWSLCGKGLVKFIAAANERGDDLSVSIYRSELEVFRLAMIQHGKRYPVARRYLKVLDEAARQTFGDKNMAFQCKSEQILDPSFQPNSYTFRPTDVPIDRSGSTSTSSSTHHTQNPLPIGDSLPFDPTVSGDSSTDQSYWDLLYGQMFPVPSEQGVRPTHAQMVTLAGPWFATPATEQPSLIAPTASMTGLAISSESEPQYSGLGTGQPFTYGTSPYQIAQPEAMTTGSSFNPVPQYPTTQQSSAHQMERPFLDLTPSESVSGMSYFDHPMSASQTGDTTAGQMLVNQPMSGSQPGDSNGDRERPSWASGQAQPSGLDWGSTW